MSNLGTAGQGANVKKIVSAASTNATVVKAAEGRLIGWSVSNVNAAVRYIKFYNLATTPTVGTDVPLMTIAIPGSTAAGTANFHIEGGIYFSVGIAFATTTEATDAGSTGISVSESVINVYYN